MGGLALPDALRLQAEGRVSPSGRAKSVIMICLEGGPSHLDMYDLKPGAPAETAMAPAGPNSCRPTSASGRSLAAGWSRTPTQTNSTAAWPNVTGATPPIRAAGTSRCGSRASPATTDPHSKPE